MRPRKSRAREFGSSRQSTPCAQKHFLVGFLLIRTLFCASLSQACVPADRIVPAPRAVAYYMGTRPSTPSLPAQVSGSTKYATLAAAHAPTRTKQTARLSTGGKAPTV